MKLSSDYRLLIMLTGFIVCCKLCSKRRQGGFFYKFTCMIESISQILSNINNVFFPHSPDLALVVHQKVRVRLDQNFRHQLTQQKSMKSIPKCNVRRCFDFHFAHLIHMTDNLLLQNLDKHDFWICNFVMHNHHMTLLLTQRHSTVSIKQLLYNHLVHMQF